MGGIEILTFGCRLNLHESEVMRARAEAAGLEDAVIVNTCAVTAEAERQARQAIRRARRERPKARIIVAGCAVQIDPGRFAAMPEVDRVLGNEEKLKQSGYGFAAPGDDRLQVGDIMAARQAAPHVIEGFDRHTRAFVQIQQGCDHRCTFCVIPFGRGNSRSVPLGAIAEQARLLVDKGCREIVLSGVDIASWGRDLPGKPSLGQGVKRLLAQVPALRRLRLSSLDPAAIDEALWRLLAEEERLMPHLHLSLQSGDDLTLKRMKRRHRRAEAVALCERARRWRPGIALGADFIAGFPTESDAMFENSLAHLAECGLSHLHVFPYSARPRTSAARMPQLPGSVIRERAARLREAGAARHLQWLTAQIGGEASVLVERNGGGHTAHFAAVRFAEPPPPGAILPARLTGIAGDRLLAEAIAA
jgi:threonylcarbamoyladenosine tRNA methylthiotransferase MtaB